MSSLSSRKPMVSVCMVCYNHAAYVGEAISSVLQQTLRDFELHILDNGSTDETLSVIKNFTDERITVDTLKENVHSTCAANILMQRARGKYVAFICSDDAWMSDKLAQQVAYLEAHPHCAVVFSRVEVIDERSRPYRLPTAYDCQFNLQPNRASWAWLRFLYGFDNPFCCSSALLRLNVWQEYGPYDERSRNVQDLLLWTRILFHYDVHILEQKLTRMRYLARRTNVSAVSLANMVLSANEAQLFYAIFYEELTSPAVFQEIFPDSSPLCSAMGNRDPQVALALHTLALLPSSMAGVAYAMRVLYSLTKTAEQRKLLQQRYGFGILDLYAKAEGADVYGMRRSLFKETLREAAKKLLQHLHLLMPLKYYLIQRALR